MSAKKPRIDKKEFFKTIKRELQSEIVNDVIVGKVLEESWQRECEIDPELFINLLEPNFKNFGLPEDCKEVSLVQCDRKLRMLAQRIVNSSDQNQYCEPDKLVVVEKGDHLEQFTESREDLTKLLVFHLPTTDCKGGTLMIGSWDPTRDFDDAMINYVLFDIDHPHQVTRVTNGKRVLLLFKVFVYPELKNWEHTKPEQRCYKKFKIYKKFKNTLFTYPNMKVLEEVLTKSRLENEQVFFYCNTPKPEKVYGNIYDINDLDIQDEDKSAKPTFDHLTEEATEFKVEYIVDIGKPSEISSEYTYLPRHVNSGKFSDERKTGVLKYFSGYLVNPKEDPQPSSSSSST